MKLEFNARCVTQSLNLRITDAEVKTHVNTCTGCIFMAKALPLRALKK
jgi:hypothetical protein